MCREDWATLARFVALQDIRTPARMLESLNRLSATAEELMQDTLHDAVAAMQLAHDEKRRLVFEPPSPKTTIPIAVRTTHEDGSDTATLGVEMVIGRGLWLSTFDLLLSHTVKSLVAHHWTILRPPEGTFWLTSDNPVVKLNYYKQEKYDLKGGWGNPGTEILLPLSPQHLLYTKVGVRRQHEKGTRINTSTADFLQRVIAENAHRYIFAYAADDTVPVIRTRIVDAAAIRREEEQWKAFHAEQSIAERELFSGKGPSVKGG